jgi:hypothetical protein
MQRQLVSTEELVNLVNQRVRQQAKTGACAIAGVLRLHKPDDDGCNWEEIGVRGTHTQGYRQAVKELRASYNLQDSL